MHRDMPLGTLLGAADAALARAESRGAFSVEMGDTGVGSVADTATLGEGAWRRRITDSLTESRVRLVQFPLVDASHELVHLECPLRLQLDPQGQFESAARWLPMALRGRLTGIIDERAVQIALADIDRDGRARCINLSSASLADSTFAARLRTALSEAPRASRGLWLDVPETAAVEHFAQVQELARQLRPLGAHVGLEHAGERLSRIEHLFEAGLDYVKLDAAVVQGVAGDAVRTSYLKSVVAMLHGLSMQVFAEGVRDEGDAVALRRLGVDGITGPWASALRADLVG